MNVAAAKIASLVRCVERAREERVDAGDDFRADFTRQDAAILNVLRACEAVHEYRELDFAIVESVIADDLDDLLTLAEKVRPHLTD